LQRSAPAAQAAETSLLGFAHIETGRKEGCGSLQNR
jgi:hypothetical protein